MKNGYYRAFAALTLWALSFNLPAQNCSYNPTPLVISGNTNWNTDRKITSDVVIQGGATLTLTAKLEMLPDGKILIKPNGKLKINAGGHITSTAGCTNSWKGIEIEGNRNQGQINFFQGKLDISGGKLSNACRAILNTVTLTGGGYDWHKTGGMIEAEDATFENNARDVTLLTYHNVAGGNELNYQARFTNCDFLRNNNYVNPAHPNSHVALLDVVGPVFEGCHFINTRDRDTNADRTAIGATNAIANFVQSTQRRGRFENYDRGIFMSGASRPDKEVHIYENDFDRNTIGIELIGCSNFKITSNTFEMKKGHWWNSVTSSQEPWQYGIYLDASYDFRIMANYFTNVSSGSPILGQTAVAVTDGMGFTNRLYKNEVDELVGGFGSFSSNRNASGTDGLLIGCNEFDLRPLGTGDVGVMGAFTGSIPQNELGVAKHQGPFVVSQKDYSKMANNLHTPGPGSNWYTFNTVSQSYYYHSNMEPRCIPGYSGKPLNLEPQTVPYDRDQWCPGPNPALQAGDVNTTLAGLDVEDQGWGGEWALFYQLIDNGSTPALEAQILAAGQPDYQNLYLDLMDLSPYVSIENLLNLLQLPNFPELAIRNILVANPHGARDPEVMEAVYNHQPPFATTTIQDIEQGSHTLTSYDVQTAKISAHNYQRHELVDRLTTYYAEEGNAMNEITQLLEDRDELLYHYALVDMELQAGLLSEAQSHLNAIASTAFMEGSDADRHQAMLGYYAVVTACLEDGRLLTQLNGEEISDLQAMSGYGPSDFPLVRAKALSLLWLNGVAAVHQKPSPDQAKTLPDYGVRPARPTAQVQAYPNPATDHLIVQWDWFNMGLTQSIEIELYNTDGRKVFSLTEADYARNTAVLRLQDHKPGSYILRMKSGEDVLYSETVLVNR